MTDLDFRKAIDELKQHEGSSSIVMAVLLEIIDDVRFCIHHSTPLEEALRRWENRATMALGAALKAKENERIEELEKAIPVPSLILGKNTDFTDSKAEFDLFKKKVIEPYLEGSLQILAEDLVEEMQDKHGIEITKEFAYDLLKTAGERAMKIWRKEYNDAKEAERGR